MMPAEEECQCITRSAHILQNSWGCLYWSLKYLCCYVKEHRYDYLWKILYIIASGKSIAMVPLVPSATQRSSFGVGPTYNKLLLAAFLAVRLYFSLG